MKAWEEVITLETGKTLEVDAVLTLGDVSQTVQVTAEVPLVSTTDPTGAVTLGHMQAQEVLTGRPTVAMSMPAGH
jgi:hypothetical protein